MAPISGHKKNYDFLYKYIYVLLGRCRQLKAKITVNLQKSDMRLPSLITRSFSSFRLYLSIANRETYNTCIKKEYYL